MRSPDRRRRLTAFAVAMAVLIATPLAVVAADAFDDVPNSNVHHDDITWLQGAGVTLGCNPPDNTEFCPGQPVLRQQMASFMRRLAENQVVDAATALEANHANDASTVEGKNATQLSSRLVSTFRDGGNGTNTLTIDTRTALGSVSLTSANGPLALITYSLYGLASGNQEIVMWLQADDETCLETTDRIPGSLARQEAADGEFRTVSSSIATSTTGDPTITLCANPQGGTSLGIRDFQLNALHANSGTAPVDLAGGGASSGGSDSD